MTNQQQKQQPSTTRVIICGAGPAGLLTAIHFLRRNSNNNKPKQKYEVTIIDKGMDFGLLDQEHLDRKRSWMISLSAHGLNAIKEIPGLFENYILKSGLEINGQKAHMGKNRVFELVSDVELHSLDRNFIVAGLSRYLHDEFGKENDSNLVCHFESDVLFVDPDHRRVLTRDNTNGKESYIDYDLLIGCDGIRSTVRGAFSLNHRDFECSSRSVFTTFKAIHIDFDAKLHGNKFHVVPKYGKHSVLWMFVPEMGNKVNIMASNRVDKPLDEELLSKDVSFVSECLKKGWTKSAPELAKGIDFDDFAKKIVDAPWSKNGQVNCNFYHSLKLKALILGDAAHATSASIGQGMNTALNDVSVLNSLLDQYDDDIEKVLPAFSKERVKEGNALTYLAFYQNRFSFWLLLWYLIEDFVRGCVAPRFPSLMNDAPMTRVARGEKLSVVYNDIVCSGRLPVLRAITEKTVLEYFEQKVGMVTSQPGKGVAYWPFMVVCLLIGMYVVDKKKLDVIW